MHIRISRARFDPARYDELRPIFDEVVAAARRQPGLHSYYGGIDRTAGTSVVVTTWETEEQARFDRAVLGDIIPRMQALGVQPEPPAIYEVVDHIHGK